MGTTSLLSHPPTLTSGSLISAESICSLPAAYLPLCLELIVTATEVDIEVVTIH